MKRTVSKICLAVLWALSLIVMVALIFFSVPYLNDAITCGGVNSIGQFSSKMPAGRLAKTHICESGYNLFNSRKKWTLRIVSPRNLYFIMTNIFCTLLF